MDWEITHECPQCGAPILFREAERILSCGFCKVRSLLRFGEPLRYVLPTSQALDDPLYFVPFWRIKGDLFWNRAGILQSKALDTTRPATDMIRLPLSLGFRPQAMKMRLSFPKGAKIVVPNLSFQEVFGFLSKSFSFLSGQEKTGTYGFLSHLNAFVYQPYYVSGKILCDGITGQRIPELNTNNTFEIQDSASYNVNLSPCICPLCGWDLKADTKSSFGICTNCNSVIDLVHDEMPKCEYSIHKGDGEIYIPFWSIKSTVEALSIKTYADLIRYFNLPKALLPHLEDKEIYYYFPAIRLIPDVFIRVARLITIAQPDCTVEKELQNVESFPISIHHKDAKDILKILIWSMGPNKPELSKLIHRSDIQIIEAHLHFIPFLETHVEFTNPKLKVSFLKGSIRGS